MEERLDLDVISPGSGAGDRRRVCRYPAVLQSAFLGWWRESCFMNLPVRLVDLSLSGCLVELDRLPDLQAQQAVWVHLHKDCQLEWIEGRVISVKKPMLRRCKVRVLFQAPLGYEPFKRLVYGPDHLRDPTQRVVPEHENDQFWR